MIPSGIEVILNHKMPGHVIGIQIFLIVIWEGLKRFMITN